MLTRIFSFATSKTFVLKNLQPKQSWIVVKVIAIRVMRRITVVRRKYAGARDAASVNYREINVVVI